MTFLISIVSAYNLVKATTCSGVSILLQNGSILPVSANTTGWVGFGVSPNGQMPRSDVVIGWVGQQWTSILSCKLKICAVIAHR